MMPCILRQLYIAEKLVHVRPMMLVEAHFGIGENVSSVALRAEHGVWAIGIALILFEQYVMTPCEDCLVQCSQQRCTSQLSTVAGDVLICALQYKMQQVDR